MTPPPRKILGRNDITRIQRVNILVLFQVVTEHFIPNFESLLQDQDPLPSYCLKLLHACVIRHVSVVNILIERNLIPTLLSMLQSHQTDITGSVLLNIVGILNSILSNREISFKLISEHGLVEHVTSGFLEVATLIDDDNSNISISPLLLQLLDMLHHVLKHVEFAVKSVLNPSNESSTAGPSREKVEVLLHESKSLSELNGILITLLMYEDSDIQEWACRCLYLSAELFGSEYEEYFTDDNALCLFQALREASKKRQKLILRIIKRFSGCSDDILNIFRKHSSELVGIMNDITKDESDDDAEAKSIRNLVAELRKLL